MTARHGTVDEWQCTYDSQVNSTVADDGLLALLVGSHVCDYKDRGDTGESEVEDKVYVYGRRIRQVCSGPLIEHSSPITDTVPDFLVIFLVQPGPAHPVAPTVAGIKS